VRRPRRLDQGQPRPRRDGHQAAFHGSGGIVGARYPASSPYKSVYAFISSSRSGSAIGEKFFTGSGASLRCATIGSKLQAGTTRYIQYQLVPKKQGGTRAKVFYQVTVQS
jgi:hypothetical protein